MAKVCYHNCMENNIEKNVADNIKALRLQAGLKQSELGEKIAYSDKTVSKWENGLSVPDITALCALADVFGLTVDDLTKENAVENLARISGDEARANRANEIAMICLSVMSVVLVACFVYTALWLFQNVNFWQVFVWMVCPSALIVYRFNRVNHNVKWVNALTLSLFLWALLAALFLQFINYMMWPLFFIGLPLQAMIIISTLFRKPKKPRR